MATATHKAVDVLRSLTEAAAGAEAAVVEGAAVQGAAAEVAALLRQRPVDLVITADTVVEHEGGCALLVGAGLLGSRCIEHVWVQPCN